MVGEAPRPQAVASRKGNFVHIAPLAPPTRQGLRDASRPMAGSGEDQDFPAPARLLFKRFETGRGLSSTYVAPAPPSQILALE